MSLTEMIAHLCSLSDKPMDLSLDRITTVADALLLLPFDCPVVTIGGTNGKGSTTATLEAMYQQAGYKTGVFSSPHMISHTELIRLNSNEVTEQQLVTALEAIDAARDTTILTEFEYLTLAALWLFKQAKPDLILLEVGLGGRDDAVNVVSADVAIITNIALDHCQWLGNDRDSIAAIKAGIMRPHKTVVLGARDLPSSIMVTAERLQVTSFQLGREFDFSINNNGTWTWRSGQQQLTKLPAPQLIIDNVATAMMAVEVLSDKLPIKALAKTLDEVLPGLTLPGRQQLLTQPCRQIRDVAHNPAAAVKLAEHLETMQIAGKIIAVFSMFGDKDIVNTIKPLASLVDSWYVAVLDHPRAASRAQLQQAFADNTITAVNDDGTIAAAYQAAVTEIDTDDLLVVFGSFQVLAELQGERC